MNKRAQFFVLANISIVLVNVGLLFTSLCLTGCSENASDWTPDDKAQIRKLISEISDARSNNDKLASIFVESALPGRQWLKQTEGYSFVVTEIDIASDQATVTLDLENHFGEIQKTVSWTCIRTDTRWQISAAPVD